MNGLLDSLNAAKPAKYERDEDTWKKQALFMNSLDREAVDRNGRVVFSHRLHSSSKQ